jgi:hypothetical protein
MALTKGHTFTSGEIVTPEKLNNLVDNATIDDDAIDSDHLVSGSIDLAHLSTDSVDASKVVDGTITAAKITDGTITAAKITDGTITAAKIADGTITATQLDSGVVSGSVTSVTAGNGLDGGEITTTGTVSIPTSGGTLNIDSGKVGIGGDADSAYHTKLTGDVLITEADTNTVLTIENTNASSGGATMILHGPTPAIQFNDTIGTADKKLFNLYGDGGAVQLKALNDAGAEVSTPISLYHDGNVKLDSLPTTDPSTTGYLWNDGGVVRVSGSTGVTLSGLPTSDPSATGELWNDGGVVSVSGSSGFSGGGGSTLTLATKQTFTSSSTDTSCEFTSIPSGVKQITIIFDDFGFWLYSGIYSPRLNFQLGDSGGYETSGYEYSICGLDSPNATSGTSDVVPAYNGMSTFAATAMRLSISEKDGFTGLVKLERIDTYSWIASWELRTLTSAGVPTQLRGSGRKTLTGTLDRLRIVSDGSGPQEQLRSGSINISYI